MNTEEREARLTAFALNDPGLSATDRQDIETTLAADPASRLAVEETRRLAQVLTAGLAAEQSALPVEPVVTIPAPQPAPRSTAGWTKYVVAAAVLLAVSGGTYLGWTKGKGSREDNLVQVAGLPAPGQGAKASGQVDYDGKVSSGNAWTGERENLQGKGDGEKREPHVSYERDPNPAERAGEVQSGPTGASPADLAKPVQPALESPSRGPASGAGGGAPGGYGPATKRLAGAADLPTDGKAPGDFPGGPFMGGGARPGMSRPAAPAAPATVPPQGLPPGTPPADPDRQTRPRDDSPLKDGDSKGGEGGWAGPGNDRHLQLIENAFTRVEGLNALSTFGVDVDTASYSIVRKYLTDGQLPPTHAVRLEEMVNYFPYADRPPAGDDPFAVSVEMAECPWEPAHRLVRLGLKAKVIDKDKRPPSNIVFLIDVSGSMDAPNRLPLVKESLKLLVGQLGDKDRIAIVVYAGSTGLVLDSTSADKKETIFNALDQLSAGGSTNGSGGIQQAYEVAAKHFIKNGTNRVVLCTDGDWNVGTTSTDALVKLIEQKRETGVYLSVFGFGMGNLRDEMLVQLAGKGNGNYGYIDTLREANKLFVEQLAGTLVTVAKDVKIQVEFNPAVVRSYRLLGYEKRALAAKDFHDDTKDAGEMGAGHVVTALYELVPVGAPDPAVGKVDGLRYQKDPAPKPAPKGEKSDEAFVVKMRHKKPDGDTSTLRELPVKDTMVTYEKASDDFQFAAAVASFSMLLRDSQYKGQSNYGLVLELAEVGKKHDPGGYRAEFIDLVRKAKSLAGK